MGNCLITKLKATVNNPDLPVIEIMQQLTLDAITRGGNMPMTEAQKYALNHFFYEIGAIENNSLWAKVRTLMLPLIGNGLNYVVQDYRHEGAAAATTSIKDQVGALSTTSSQVRNNFNSSKPLVTLNVKNRAMIIACTKTSTFSGSTGIGFSSVNSNNDRLETTISTLATSTLGSQLLYVPNGGSEVAANKRFESGVTSIVIELTNVTSDGITAKGILSDGTTVSTTNTAYGNFSNIISNVEESYYKLIAVQKDLGILIDFNSALTNDEQTIVLNAVKDLRASFLTND